MNMGATAAARTWAGSSTSECLTLNIAVSGRHSVSRLLLLFRGVTRLYSAGEDKYHKTGTAMFSHISSTSLLVPPGCGLREQEVITEGQCLHTTGCPWTLPQPNQPSWQRFLAEITSRGSPVPHLTTTSGARSQ